MYPDSIKKIIEAFKYFPGIGEKSAERFAFHIINMDQEQIDFICDALKNVKKDLKRCSICNNLSDSDKCSICTNKERLSDTLCLVEDPKTVFLLEKLGTFKGKYHVLDGLISSFNNVSPEELKLNTLIDRINNEHIKELIIAFKPCIEGEMTSLYIKNILSGMNVKVTRLAQGIPMGAEMDYIDAITMERAFDNRKSID
jgi:recombination protein RecR